MQIKFPMKSRKQQHRYLQDPATICSPIGRRIQNITPCLASSLAVNGIIRAIKKRQVVHRLDLGASSLGDVGCTRLFEFLASPAGLRCREGLTELFLTKNEIGAQGLLAVVTFLKGNMVLRELCLSGNPLTTDPHVITEFTHAVNSSRLCTLQILHSGSLGDSFTQVFLSQLSSPYLRELDLSAINMTQAIVPTLADYVRSGRCRLNRLQCNANSLTLTGAHKIICAIEENYSLRNVKLDDLHIHDQTATLTLEERAIEWRDCSRALSSILGRNSELMARVKHDSLALLRYARALFLWSGTGRRLSSSQRNRNWRSHDAPSPFFTLPAELQQQIISYLAPSLSHQQRMRILHFASDTATLFGSHCQSNGTHSWTQQLEGRGTTSLGGRLLSHCGHPFEGTWRPPVWWECHCSQASCRCLRRWRKEMRDMWFTQVACNTYEPVF